MCAQYWICPDTVRYSAWAAALTACANSGVSSMVTFTKPLYRKARRHPASHFPLAHNAAQGRWCGRLSTSSLPNTRQYRRAQVIYTGNCPRT